VSDPIIGIDFGTSNSAVAVCDEHGDPRVLTDSSGNSIQPSVVSFHPSGSVMVGAKAKQRRILDPKNTVYSAKRLLGRTFDSREVTTAVERMPFVIKQGVNLQPVIVTRAGELSVPEMVAIVLDHMRGVATEALEAEVTRAVVTVPANATDAQRTATVTAGQIAGLEIVQVLNEPTAAALAYGHRRTLDHMVAVYDFGGGTFDVTILQVRDEVYEVLATAGNTFLGGDDIDERMADVMVAQLQAEHGVDIRGDEQGMQRLRSVAEQVKIELSRRNRAMVKIDAIARDRAGKPLDFSVRLTREQLEAEATPIVGRSFDVCQEALRRAGIAAARVDAVILVGGTTKMPLVRRQVASFFNQEPRVDVDPDDAVALGAALQAFALRTQLGVRVRRNTARDAVVPPAPPMEARSATSRGRDSGFERGSTVPWSAFWEREGEEGNVTNEDGNITGNQTGEEGTETLDTMDVPTVDHGHVKAQVAAGLRKPAPGSVDYVSKSARPTSRARPAARIAGPQDGTIEVDPIGLETTDVDLGNTPPAAPAPGGGTVRGLGAPGREARQPAGAEQDGGGRSILQELDLGSLGVEVHRGPDATGSRPIDLARFPKAGARGRAEPPPDAADSQAAIQTEVRGAGLDDAPALAPMPATGRVPGPGPARGPVPERGPGPARGSGPERGPGPALGSGPVPGRAPGRASGPGPGPVQSPGVYGPGLAPGMQPAGDARRLEPQRTLQHPAGAPLPEAAPLPRAPTIIEVTPHTLGVGTVAGYCQELLRRNSRVPAQVQEVFTTSKDGQQTVRIRICQGESRRLQENVILGDLVLDGIEPRPRGEIRIAVTFHIDQNGILHVRARDENTGREQRADLELLGQPSQEEVSTATARLRTMRGQQGQ
jgi:molecular chaperone DnaK